MRRAVALSAVGRRATSPNPIVGAVVLDAGGPSSARAGTERAGGPHAEVVALARGRRARPRRHRRRHPRALRPHRPHRTVHRRAARGRRRPRRRRGRRPHRGRGRRRRAAARRRRRGRGRACSRPRPRPANERWLTARTPRPAVRRLEVRRDPRRPGRRRRRHQPLDLRRRVARRRAPAARRVRRDRRRRRAPCSPTTRTLTVRDADGRPAGRPAAAGRRRHPRPHAADRPGPRRRGPDAGSPTAAELGTGRRRRRRPDRPARARCSARGRRRRAARGRADAWPARSCAPGSSTGSSPTSPRPCSAPGRPPLGGHRGRDARRRACALDIIDVDASAPTCGSQAARGPPHDRRRSV